MKLPGIGVAVCLALLAAVSWFAAPSEAALQDKRQQAVQKFEELKANALKAQQAGRIHTKSVAVGDKKVNVAVGKLNIEPVPSAGGGGEPVELAVKIWGELTSGSDFQPNGQYINLTKHKWQRKERFYLWFESAVPVQIAIFQNYGDDILPTRQVLPDERYEESFQTIMPGKPERVKMRFYMDDNLRDEIMAVVLARTDCDHLPLNAANPASPPPVEGGGSAGAGGELKMTKQAFTKLNQQSLKTGHVDGKATKLNIEPPPTSSPPVSTSADDVSHLLLGAGKVGHLQITLHKD